MMLQDAESYVRVQNIYNPENFDRSLRPAAEFIAKGKYIEGNDEQGDIIYRMAQKMESVIHSFERVAETERRAMVDEEGLEKNLECMQQWFNEAGYSSAGSSTGAVLDGHGGRQLQQGQQGRGN
jgi:hypothetical protein